MKDKTIGDWLAPSQAARAIGISSQRVRQLMDTGRLRYQSTALGRIIDPRSVENAIAERQARADKAQREIVAA